MTQFLPIAVIFSFLIALGCNSQAQTKESMNNSKELKFPVQKTEEQWRQELSPEQYYVLRQKGTERPGTGQYNLHFKNGTYQCAACGEDLFDSNSKFDAHCGWPSFDQEIEKGKIVEKIDRSHGMLRTEILCGNCGGHLGHVFNDGPTSTGLRYCVNSLSLDFTAEEESELGFEDEEESLDNKEE